LQEHSFFCAQCKQRIKIALHLDFEKIEGELKYIENCEESNVEGSIVNLDPLYVFSEEEVNQDSVFTGMKQSYDIISKRLREIPHKDKDLHKLLLTEVPELLTNRFGVVETWNKVKKAWGLSIEGQNGLAQEIIDDLVPDKNVEINDLVFRFFTKLMGRNKISLFMNAGQKIAETARGNRSEFLKLRMYYRNNLMKEYLHDYLEIFSEFFLGYPEFGQTMVYVSNDMKYPEGHVASSTGFEEVKMFYGNAYEVLTSHLLIFACLNNISLGRPFDTFEDMTLDKYRKTHKAHRARPFDNCAEYKAIVSSLDSILRNASHHRSMRLTGSKRHVEYRSGGTGAWHRISYGEYLYKCNSVAISLMALLALELLFTSD
jgi:hypothetical protein